MATPHELKVRMVNEMHGLLKSISNDGSDETFLLKRWLKIPESKEELSLMMTERLPEGIDSWKEAVLYEAHVDDIDWHKIEQSVMRHVYRNIADIAGSHGLFIDDPYDDRMFK
jgi:hypothetical protein